ncbi:MAG: hypothetical protein AVDCRST_MAG93-9318, partial [uncultured Chloroflexia bacterium]
LAVRVAFSIPALVVMPNNGHATYEIRVALQKIGTTCRMGLHDRSLFCVQGTGFIEDTVRDSDLTDIMDASGGKNEFSIRAFKPEVAQNFSTQCCDAA